VIGWANVSVKGDAIDVDLGYVSGRAPRDRGYRSALDQEIASMRSFLLDD
jgi:hypothetical protein